MEMRIRKPIPRNQHPIPDKASDSTTVLDSDSLFFLADWLPNRPLELAGSILVMKETPQKIAFPVQSFVRLLPL